MYGLTTICVLLSLVGCGSEAALRAEPSVLASPADGETRSAVLASELLPFEPQQGVYVMTEGEQEGRRISFRVYHDEDRESWVLEKQRWAHHALEHNDAGDVMIPHESDLRERALVEYEPAIMLLPSELVEGERHEGEMKVTIRDLDSGKIKHRGSGTWSVQGLGWREVMLPAGTFDAYHVRVMRDISTTFASVSVTIDFDYVPGIGPASETVTKTTRPLGIFSSTTSWQMQLAEPNAVPETK